MVHTIISTIGSINYALISNFFDFAGFADQWLQ
jgi:hypothetical protein